MLVPPFYYTGLLWCTDFGCNINDNNKMNWHSVKRGGNLQWEDYDINIFNHKSKNAKLTIENPMFERHSYHPNSYSEVKACLVEYQGITGKKY